MKRPRGRIAGLAALALLTLGGIFLASQSGDGASSALPSLAAAPPVPSPAISRSVADPGLARELPRSLRGTDVDGGLSIDRSGHFVPDPDALALFDYFLAATGEAPADEIAQWIRAHIARTLEPPAEAEALALLERCLAYRDAARELAESEAVPADLERRLQWLRELRRAHFGADVAEALFGLEEDVTRIDLERRRVAQDPALTLAERAAELAALESELPEPVREARGRARAPGRSYREVLDLRAAGASEAEIFVARARRFGPEAAGRLAALDREQAAWQARLDAYRAERRALLDAGTQANTLEGLRHRHFSPEELPRVRAIDGF